MNLSNIIPSINWIKEYNFDYFKSDLNAGLIVGITMIPQGMAYALIAGLPAVYGLYASIIPQIVYAFLGTSRQLSVGPVAMDSLLVASGLAALKLTGIEDYIQMALFLSFFMGSIQLMMGIFKMGFLVNFLSRPVIIGFTSAAAIIIALNQFKYLFGIPVIRSNEVHKLILSIIENINSINFYAFFIGLSSVLLLFLSKKYLGKFPMAIMVVITSILVVYFWQLDKKGVEILSEVPSGLPSFNSSFFNFERTRDLSLIAFSLALIAFMEAISLSKAIEDKHTEYRVNSNQELIALGSANILGSFFQAYPTSGGLSRSALNDQSGAKTGIASIIAATVVCLTLLYFTSFFYYLPNAALGAIIFVGVVSLVDFKFPKQLWVYKKDEFALYIFTFLITLFFGIRDGILLGVCLSLAFLIFQVSYPHVVVLGKIPNSDQYRNVKRFDDLEIDPDTLIIRFDAPLFFANATYFRDFVNENLQNQKNVIVDASAINSIDSTAYKVLNDLNDELNNRNIDLYLVEVKGPVRDILSSTGFMKESNSNYFFLNIEDAIHYIKNHEEKRNKKYILQSRQRMGNK